MGGWSVRIRGRNTNGPVLILGGAKVRVRAGENVRVSVAAVSGCCRRGVCMLDLCSFEVLQFRV